MQKKVEIGTSHRFSSGPTITVKIEKKSINSLSLLTKSKEVEIKSEAAQYKGNGDGFITDHALKKIHKETFDCFPRFYPDRGLLNAFMASIENVSCK